MDEKKQNELLFMDEKKQNEEKETKKLTFGRVDERGDVKEVKKIPINWYSVLHNNNKRGRGDTSC